MSTRSFIGYQHNVGEFRGMYCHYDGYPSHVGAILAKHHSSFESLCEIVYGGQIRNFDNDGTIVRFGDEGDDNPESFVNLAEVLNDVYDYAYLFDQGENRWRCFERNRDLLIEEVNIPVNELTV